MDQKIEARIKEWMKDPFDEATKMVIKKRLESDPSSLENPFSKDLEFGTGGLRGIMDVGPNCINFYTISKASVGVATYFQHLHPKKHLLAVIGYDCRHQSKEFAHQCAQVFSSFGIKSYITSHLRPTPFISFLIRHLKADFGVMITASHNPKNYNGYKVYGEDGAQIVHPHDVAIEKIVRMTHFDQLQKQLASSLPSIFYTDPSHDAAYLKALFDQALHLKQSLDFGKSISILYTNLHGTGLTLLPYALKQLGFKNLHFVEKQTTYDSEFTYAPSPNPEDKKALELGLDLMQKNHYDLFIATDPDADRLAATIMHQNTPHILTGNEMAVLCLYHLLHHDSIEQKIFPDSLVVSTIVSTRLLKKIALDFNVQYVDVLTGFKYIGEKIRDLDQLGKTDRFIFGAEESYGFLYGTYARDKDGIAASCLMAEMVLHYRLKNKSLLDVLDEIYQTYGLIKEGVSTIDLGTSLDGATQKDIIMQTLFEEKFEMEGVNIAKIHHYEKGYVIDLSTGEKEKIDLPLTSAIGFEFDDETSLIIRPSGTEPKIKIYANYQIKSFLDVGQAKNECQLQLKKRLDYVKSKLLSYV